MATVVLSVIPALVALVVVAMGASLHFLGDVMHAGGPQMLDRHHELMHALVAVAVPFALVVFPVAVLAFALTMKMGDFLFQFTLQALGLLAATTPVQFLDAPLLPVGPALEFITFMILLGMFMVMMVSLKRFESRP